jgi:electron transfer flavoprotein alpha subunit
MSILVLIHTEADRSLGKPALEALNAALALGAVQVGLIGESVAAAADSIAGCGATAFFAVEGEAFAQSRYCTDAAAAEAICRAANADLIVAPGTSRWMRALPGVAGRIGARVDSHVTAISVDGVRRWLYRNRIEGTLSREAKPWLILLDGGAAPPWTGAPGKARISALDVPAIAPRTSVLRMEAPREDEQTIRPDARLLLVAGAGWTKKQKDGRTHAEEAAELISDVLKATGASLGSSKSLVDLGSEGESVLPFLTHMHQVGQTGASPRHPKGLATCCHGEEPHVVGWRFIGERRAINLDPNCGWARRKADVLYVADAFEVMREMRKLLGARQAGA